MRHPRAAIVALATVALVMAGCGSSGSGDPSSPRADQTGVVEVPADGETQPTEHDGDSADDPAIWVNRQDPAKSLIIGNDKQGALETYDLDGRLVQRIEAATKFWGNVDVRQAVNLGAGTADIVAAANAGLRLYAVNRETRLLEPITVDGGPLDTTGGEGVCLFNSPDGNLAVFMVFISGNVKQFLLEGDGLGHLSADGVRSFKVGSEAEGCVVDDHNRALYINEENTGTWRYDAGVGAGAKRTLVDGIVSKGHQLPDVEGITMIDDGAGNGLIFSSSQGQVEEKSYFTVYDRRSNDYRSRFRIVDGPNADGCSHTDGIAATAESLGPQFPNGAFVCQDDHNTAPGLSGHQDFKITRLEKVRP